MSLEVQRTAEALTLRLSGDWGVREFGTLENDFAAVDLRGAHVLVIDTAGLTSLDLTGAWSLHEFVRRTRAAGLEVSFLGAAPDQLRLLDETLKETDAAVAAPQPAAAAPPPAGRLGRLLAEHRPRDARLPRRDAGELHLPGPHHGERARQSSRA